MSDVTSIGSLPPMTPSEMTSILSDEAAVSGLSSLGSAPTQPSLSLPDGVTFSSGEQVEMEELQASASEVSTLMPGTTAPTLDAGLGVILQLSAEAQTQLTP